MELTPTETKLLTLVATHASEYGYQPNYREIADMMQWKSTAHVSRLIRSIKGKGLVTSAGARSIKFNWREYVDPSLESVRPLPREGEQG